MHIAILNDDNEEVYNLQEMIFNISGNYRIDRFSEGRDLLKAAGDGAVYDLLLCDVYMKEENGIEIAKQMKSVRTRRWLLSQAAGNTRWMLFP